MKVHKYLIHIIHFCSKSNMHLDWNQAIRIVSYITTKVPKTDIVCDRKKKSFEESEKNQLNLSIECARWDSIDRRSLHLFQCIVWVWLCFVSFNVKQRYYRLSTHFTKPYRFIVGNQTCVFSFTHLFGMCATKMFVSLFLRFGFPLNCPPLPSEWEGKRDRAPKTGASRYWDGMEWGMVGCFSPCTLLCSSTESTWTRTMDKVFDMYFNIVITAISLWDKSNRVWVCFAWHTQTVCTCRCRLLPSSFSRPRL